MVPPRRNGGKAMSYETISLLLQASQVAISLATLLATLKR
jgi:hypothetical protein